MSTPAQQALHKRVVRAKSNERLLEYAKYAPQFDEMCELVPAYQENIDLLLNLLPHLSLADDARICDLGAGTGNFICAVSDLMPNARFTHLDMDSGMNEYARLKYEQRRLSNYEIIESHIQTAEFESNAFDLLICVNALNTAPPQLPVLRMMFSWLKPGATMFLIDFGRQQKVVDWTWYMFKHTFARHGLGRVFRALWNNREAIRQNRRAREDQKAGRMWLHTTEELRRHVELAGFEVDVSQTCYRGFSDLVVAHKRLG